MKNLFYSVGLTAFIAFTASCSVQKATSYSYSEYQSVSPRQSVYATPLIADLQVSENKITYAEMIEKDITEMTEAEVEALANREKENVIANAVKANHADVLVAPVVNIQTDKKNNLVIVVTGFPAEYKSFRKADSNDLWIINTSASVQTTSNKEETSSPFGKMFKKK